MGLYSCHTVWRAVNGSASMVGARLHVKYVWEIAIHNPQHERLLNGFIRSEIERERFRQQLLITLRRNLILPDYQVLANRQAFGLIPPIVRGCRTNVALIWETGSLYLTIISKWGWCALWRLGATKCPEIVGEYPKRARELSAVIHPSMLTRVKVVGGYHGRRSRQLSRYRRPRYRRLIMLGQIY